MEQQIMNCWSVCDDLDTLMEGVLEYNMTQDRITNVLIGMKDLYQLKFEKLFDQFEAMLQQQAQTKEPTKLQVKRYESQGIDWPFGKSQSGTGCNSTGL
jgi:hypothetical protein